MGKEANMTTRADNSINQGLYNNVLPSINIVNGISAYIQQDADLMQIFSTNVFIYNKTDIQLSTLPQVLIMPLDTSKQVGDITGEISITFSIPMGNARDLATTSVTLLADLLGLKLRSQAFNDYIRNTCPYIMRICNNIIQAYEDAIINQEKGIITMALKVDYYINWLSYVQYLSDNGVEISALMNKLTTLMTSLQTSEILT